MTRFTHVTIAAIFVWPITGLAQEPARTFTEGVYRQDGKCAQLLRFGNDETLQCESHVGVLARQNDIPEFMFFKGKNIRVFVAEKTAQFSEGNRLINYPIGRVVDFESGLKYDVYGDCTLKIVQGKEEIECSAWSNKEKSEPMFKASFVGNGMWIHKPSFSNKP